MAGLAGIEKHYLFPALSQRVGTGETDDSRADDDRSAHSVAARTAAARPVALTPAGTSSPRLAR